MGCGDVEVDDCAMFAMIAQTKRGVKDVAIVCWVRFRVCRSEMDSVSLSRRLKDSSAHATTRRRI